MSKYEHLYLEDCRFKRYVDACANDEGKTPAELLECATIRMVGDYYAENPARETPTTETTKVGCGGC